MSEVLEDIFEDIVAPSQFGTVGTDNMTAILIKLIKNKTNR